MPRLPHRLLLWAAALGGSALAVAPACGGRDTLPLGLDRAGTGGTRTADGGGPAAVGQGGSTSVGQGGASTTTSVGQGGVSTTTSVGQGGARTAVSTGVGGFAASAGVGGASVTTTAGVGGAQTTTGVGGAQTTTGASTTATTTSGVGGGGPASCFSCVTANCPQAAACFQNPSCLDGVICSATQCFGGGDPSFSCMLTCFDGDFMAAFQALQAMSCIFSQCEQACQGLLGP